MNSGAHSDTRDIFNERLNHGRSFVPMSIVQHSDPYSTHCTVAHEIGHAYKFIKIIIMKYFINSTHIFIYYSSICHIIKYQSCLTIHKNN